MQNGSVVPAVSMPTFNSYTSQLAVSVPDAANSQWSEGGACFFHQIFYIFFGPFSILV